MFRLEGRTALITGAASGIGAATARRFAKAGANVALAWYSADPHDIEPVRRDCEAEGYGVLVREVDVRRVEDVDALAAAAIEQFGSLDIVVANAGIARTVPALELTDDKWYQTLDVDLTGVWRCFRAALPYMTEAGYGRLLATSSVAGTVQAWPEHVQYTAAKAGIVGMVESLAVELGPKGITVNCVAPGVVESPQSLDPVNSLGHEGVAVAAQKTPVGRVGTPDDIAALYQYLASEEAGFLSGQVIVIDGARALAGLD